MKFLLLIIGLISFASFANNPSPVVPCGGGSDSNCRNQSDSDLSVTDKTSHHGCRDVEGVDCITGNSQSKQIKCSLVNDEGTIINCNGRLYEREPDLGPQNN